MRVAVRHTDPDHDNAHWFAYEQGRILGFVHPISGESYTREQVTEALLKRAKQQYPEDEGYEHRVETLHTEALDEQGKEIGVWHPAGQSDLPLAGQGAVRTQTLVIEQEQEEGTEQR